MPLDCPKVGAKWRTHCRPSNLQLFRFFQWRNVKNLFQVLLRNENNWRIETIGGVSVLWMFIELQPSQLGNWLQADPWKKTWISCHFYISRRLHSLALAPTYLARCGELPHRHRWRVGSQCFRAVTDRGHAVTVIQLGKWRSFSEWTNSTPGFNTWQHTDERHTFKNWGIWIKDN